jgi:hypothetical protein
MIVSGAVIIVLDLFILLIATHYHRFYSHYCQEEEPFTRWFSRIREAFKWFWWGLELALIIYSGLTARFADHLWPIIGCEGLLFMGWFCFHIEAYVSQHPDNPPIKIIWRRL